MRHLTLGEGAEFDRIRAALERLGDAARSVGDDVAVIPPGKEPVVVGTDLTIEDIHFKRDWLDFGELGWRAATAALSDLAAEGAEAVGLLASVGWPADLSDAEYAALMRGVGDAVQAAGGVVLGGDLSRSERIVIDAVAVGRVERAVTRDGAGPGDTLWVTGRFGGPAAALAAWAAGQNPLAAHRARFARPEARIAAGQWLASRGARAMIDVSDGLVADAGHLAAASGVAMQIALDDLPLVDGVKDPYLAAASGEEYELLAAMPAGFEPARAPVLLTRLGSCRAGFGVETTVKGDIVEPPPGFDHFRA